MGCLGVGLGVVVDLGVAAPGLGLFDGLKGNQKEDREAVVGACCKKHIPF